MAAPWEAEVEVGRELAERLVGEQFPAFAGLDVQRLGAGWDNMAWRFGETVFRFPRRRVAVSILRNEVHALRAVDGRLPLATPDPAFLGRPGEGYPWPFVGYRMLGGETACGRGLGSVSAARAMGEFLAALHAVPVPGGLPGDEIGRSDLLRRRERLLEWLPRLPHPPPHLADALADLARTPGWDGPPRLVHGDLYVRHVLVDVDGEPCGVIDWGDVHAGDPALDLSLAWSAFAGDAREALLATYGPVDDATRARARFKAISYGVVLSCWGAETGDEAMVRAGRKALEAGDPSVEAWSALPG
jgi:aminoglycoside phosphotransferase (APT) family kinase protein